MATTEEDGDQELTTTSNPGPLLERYRALVDDWPALLDAVSRPQPVCVWANPARITPELLETILREDGMGPAALAWRPGAWRLEGHRDPGRRWWNLAGLCHVQEEASMLPVRLLAPRPGHRVLDLCAAPGGKTAEIAFALGNRGTIVANDVSASRMRALRGTLERLGVVNVTDTLHDGCGFPPTAGSFDRVLVDVPCSAEGTLRRNPVPGGREGEWLSRRYGGRQRALLRRAVALCAPGGRIVYSTCTFAPEENEAVVDAVLRESASRGIRVVEPQIDGLWLTPGVTTWDGARYLPDVSRTVRLWPHHNDSGGFFAAVLEKDTGPSGPVAPAGALADVKAEDWRPYTADRFGFPDETWKRYRVHRRTKRGVHVVSVDHASPAVPGVQSTGILLVKGRIRYPKLTTAGALLIGSAAVRNVIDLAPEQVEAYHGRSEIALDPGQDADCTETGYVVLRHRGHALGTGLYEAARGTVQSLFPERWNPGPGCATRPQLRGSDVSARSARDTS